MTTTAFVFETSALLAMALALVWLMPRRSAALRHWVLTAAVAASLALPPLARMSPAWTIPSVLWSPAVDTSMATMDAPAPLREETATATAPTTTAAGAATGLRETAALPLLIWSLGTAAMVLTLGAGLVQLFAAARRGTRIVDGMRHELAREMAARLGLTRPIALLETADPSLLVACGWWTPAVLLPPSSRTWSAARTRIVLAHELAHIARGDWGSQLAAEILRSILWFNPLAWIVARRLREESERACDDVVLSNAIDGVDYAGELLALARALRPVRSWSPAPAMARPSSLERRVTAMLDVHLARAPLGRASRLAVAVVAVLCTVVLAGFGAQAQSFSSVSGRALDPLGGHIGGVAVTLTNQASRQKYLVASDLTGRFEVVGVVPGEYLIEAKMPGFTPIRQRLTVAARSVQYDVTLSVGSLEEQITVGAPPPPPPPPPPAPPMPRAMSASDVCVPTPGGGVLKPPTKTVDVRPKLPPGRAREDIATHFVFNATIGADGTVTELEPTEPASDQELVMAAMDAIRQWRFTPTLLNCTPIPVSMRVTVSFRN